MKTMLSIFTVILGLGVFSTITNAGPNTLPDLEGNNPRINTTATQQPRKQLDTPPATLQTPTRTNFRPMLKSSSSFKSLPNDDRKNIDGSMPPVD
jgi:predicted small lipoprotein YifL